MSLLGWFRNYNDYVEFSRCWWRNWILRRNCKHI
jgi:hypothetical protein